MRFGVEIEFRHPTRRADLAEQLNCSLSDNYIEEGRWNLGTDMSLAPPLSLPWSELLKKSDMNKFELRSPILTEFDERLEEILATIKRTGGDCSGCCGLHIHFSGDELAQAVYRYNEFVLNKVERAVIAKYSKSVRPQRSSYCLADNGRYVPVRIINLAHIEIRVFNSTFNANCIRRHVKESWELIQKTIDNYQKYDTV